jgi:hypothetical protein
VSICIETSCVFPAVDGVWCRTHARDREAVMSPVGSSAALGDSSNGTSYAEFVASAAICKVDAQKAQPARVLRLRC